MTMSRSIQVVIAPDPYATRILVSDPQGYTLLKGHLAPYTSHPRALPVLLEALALWEGTMLRGVLSVDEWDASCARSLCRGLSGDEGAPLFTLDWVPRASEHREGDHPARLSNFSDLRRLVAREGRR
jgi:hypothetical protein